MKYIIDDKKYNFKSAFDTETGAYIRTGILDENGRDTGIDPFMASFPHLIDVGVMGHCIHGKTGLCAKAGIGCYQSGMLVEQPNMSLDDFRWIAQQCKGRCNQLALGGRGDPDPEKALYWAKKLIELGNSSGMFLLGVFMKKGLELSVTLRRPPNG